MKTLIRRLSSVLNDRKSGSTAIALNFLNELKRIPERDSSYGLFAFDLMATKRKEMSVLVNLGKTGSGMIEKGYSLNYVCDYLINMLTEGTLKSSLYATKKLSGYVSFLTLSDSEQIRTLFLQMNKNIRVFIFKTKFQLEGCNLGKFISKIGIKHYFIGVQKLNEVLDKVECLVTGSDAVMPHIFSNRSGTMFLVTRMFLINKPSYVLTTRLKFTNNQYYTFFDSKNFDLIPNRFVTTFFSDIGSINGTSIYKALTTQYAR
ncbi:MAG: hypothetical protein QXV32_00705 [Conexivisphaerales archaeon]